MNVRVAVKGIDDKSLLRSQAEEKVTAALERFQDQIRNVMVLVENATGSHKPSVDMRCRIDVQLRRGGELLIDEIGPSIYVSLAVAIDRVKAVISRKINKRKQGIGAG